MHDPCFTERTLQTVKPGKTYNPLPSAFIHISVRPFSLWQLFTQLLLSAAQYAVMPDLYKPAWQDMQAKPAQELHSRQMGQLLFALVLIVLVLEGDALLINVLDPVIADRYPVGVLSQVFYNLLRIAQRRLAVNHPWLFPKLIEQGLILGQLVALPELAFDLFEHLAPEHRAEHAHRVKIFALFGDVFQVTL